MKVRDLLVILERAPKDAEILVPASDHSYRSPSVSVTTALKDRSDWTEDHGEAVTPEKEYGKRVPAVILE